MSIDKLKLILYDTYQMDVLVPFPSYKLKEEFNKVSYSKWAVDELENYIVKKMYPLTSGSIDEFCAITYEFMMKMTQYSRVNKRTSQIFQTASAVAADILDLLRAMR